MAKRGNGEGSITRRKNKDGKITGWMAQYYIRTPTGRKRKTIYGKTRQEVASKLTTAISDRSVGRTFNTGRMTVAEYLEGWLRDSVKGSVLETTYSSYSYMNRVHISPVIGNLKLKNLTPADVRGLYGEKTRSRLAAASVKKMHIVLRKALSQVVSDGLIPRNVADGIKTPRVSPPGEKIRPLEIEECKKFLDAASGERLSALFIVAIRCGLREGELLALRWEDLHLDSEKPALRVRRTLTRGEDGRGWVIGTSTKSSRGRRVRLTNHTVAELREHRKKQIEERTRRGNGWNEQDLVFPNRNGTTINPSNLRNRAFKRVKKRFGTRDDLRFHDLRHTCATLLLSKNVNPKVVSEMLGHASITITLNTYSHVLPDMQDTAAEAMESVFEDTH